MRDIENETGGLDLHIRDVEIETWSDFAHTADAAGGAPEPRSLPAGSDYFPQEVTPAGILNRCVGPSLARLLR